MKRAGGQTFHVKTSNIPEKRTQKIKVSSCCTQRVVIINHFVSLFPGSKFVVKIWVYVWAWERKTEKSAYVCICRKCQWHNTTYTGWALVFSLDILMSSHLSTIRSTSCFVTWVVFCCLDAPPLIEQVPYWWAFRLFVIYVHLFQTMWPKGSCYPLLCTLVKIFFGINS